MWGGPQGRSPGPRRAPGPGQPRAGRGPARTRSGNVNFVTNPKAWFVEGRGWTRRWWRRAGRSFERPRGGWFRARTRRAVASGRARCGRGGLGSRGRSGAGNSGRGLQHRYQRVREGISGRVPSRRWGSAREEESQEHRVFAIPWPAGRRRGREWTKSERRKASGRRGRWRDWMVGPCGERRRPWRWPEGCRR